MAVLFDERRYEGTTHHSVHSPLLADLETLLSNGMFDRTFWAITGSGNPDADGSAFAPFNVTSANKVGIQNFDPIKQLALAGAADPPENRQQEMAGHQYVVNQGEYPQSDIDWALHSKQTINIYGGTRFGDSGSAGTTKWKAQAASVAFGSPEFPQLTIQQVASPGNIQLFADLEIGNGDSGQVVGLTLTDVSIQDLIEVTMDALLVLKLFNVTNGGPVNCPNADLLMHGADSGSFAIGALTVDKLSSMHKYRTLGVITLSSAPSFPSNGITGCIIGANWVGPAGTARFDKFTQDNFAGAFSGGASSSDFLEA